MAIGAVTAMMAVALPLLALPASADTTPPWEMNNTEALGTLTFYNSAGQVVTSGNNLNHLFDYAQASTTDATGGTKATLLFAAPDPNKTAPNFFTLISSASTNFPNASAPGSLATSPNPVVSLTSVDGNLNNLISQVPAQTATGYANVFQVRVETSGPGGVGTGPDAYWDADVLVNPTAGTWTELYPVTGTTAESTNTVLAASPNGSAPKGSPVTLTATVTAADGTTHPAGTVQFERDGFFVGTPQTVNTTDGTASFTTSSLLASPPGGAALSAVFTPADPTSFQPSTGTLSYTVTPVAKKPTLSGLHQAGQKETCTESTGKLDFGVKAKYTWLVSGKSIATTTTTNSSSSITVPGSAVGKLLSCSVSVSDGGTPPSTATSSSVKVILGKALKPTKAPTLTGTHKVGRVETVHAGTWPRGAKFTYQSLLNGRAIRGATRTTLRLISSERGKKISCRVTAHLFGFRNGVATTGSVTVVR